LNEYNFTAAVFLITDYCGRYNDWSGNLPGIERGKLMNWSEIKELSNCGIEFAAHSKTHPDLTKLTAKEAEREILESKLAIEERLGVSVTDFAYPYGKYNSVVKQLAKRHFKRAYSTRLGKVRFSDDPFSLKRVDTYYLSNERVFHSIMTCGFDLYLSFRQLARDLKKSLGYNK
jgi:peptidoglycan/xylan/chitin deacetylase (PgdA/CDA1 family)